VCHVHGLARLAGLARLHRLLAELAGRSHRLRMSCRFYGGVVRKEAVLRDDVLVLAEAV
jgi:hypothetical protein